MFCRFCGAHLLDDSIFCAKCGKKLGRTPNPRLEKISHTLHLRTPYPYAAFLLLLVTVWALVPRAAPVDYSSLELTFQSNRKQDVADSNLYQEGFSLIVENKGSKAIRDIPVELRARIEPPQAADIATTFQGRRVEILQGGRNLPLTGILGGEVQPGSKRTFLMEINIHAQPPFKVTYEIRELNTDKLLADFVVAR
jgi:hypothetical protein